MREGWNREVLDAACEIAYGTRVTKKQDAGTAYPVYGGGGETFRLDRFNREDCTIVARFGMSESCVRHVAGKFFLNDSGLSLAPKDPNKLIPRFLDYFLYASQPAIYRLGRGSAQKNLDVKAFRQLELCYPESLSEQKRIVAILDEAFAGITTTVANTEKNLANARELFESYLNSTFNRLHDTCGVKAISQIAVVKGGKRVPKGYKLESNPTAFPYITVSAFTDEGGIDPSGVKYMDEDIYKQISRYIITTSDVYISIAGTIGKTGIIPDHLDGANLTENACRLVLQPGVFNRFVYFFTRTVSFADQALKNTRVAAQPKLALERLKTITLPIPPRELQEQMVGEFDGLLTEVRRLESIQNQKLNALVELKQSLLQRAFSGEFTTAPQDEIETALA